ncbi:MAG: energy transducer TonB [Desulfuromonadales bacterium]|nr:energy transducer TonB [Desulfuromonadales bacterium]
MACLLLSCGLHGGASLLEWSNGPGQRSMASTGMTVSLVEMPVASAVVAPAPVVSPPPAPARAPEPRRREPVKKERVVSESARAVEPPVCAEPRPLPTEVATEAMAAVTDVAGTTPVDLSGGDAGDVTVSDSTAHVASGGGDDRDVGPVAAAPAGQAGSAMPARVDARPRYKSNPLPEYPHQARVRRWTGDVLLLVEVDADGRVTSLAVEQSSGHPLLDRAARRAVRHWEFLPASQAGLPVASRVLVPVSFQLEGS